MPLSVPDQIMVAGKLTNGAAVSAHFRGGLSRGTNFHVEVNGTCGDLIITSPVGYVGIGGTRLAGARGDEALHELKIPPSFDPHHELEEPARSMAAAYARLASDKIRGTRLSPTFDDAVELHQLIDTIERSGSL
jgi:predicted dehydrogenase